MAEQEQVGATTTSTIPSAQAQDGPRQLRAEIYTPTGSVFTGNVRTVVAPGVMGEMGILPLHAPIMTPLRIGELRLNVDEHTEVLYALGGGFMEVRDDRVIILSPSAEAASDIDIERAEAAKSDAEKALAEGHDSDEDVERAQEELSRALNRINVAKR